MAHRIVTGDFRQGEKDDGVEIQEDETTAVTFHSRSGDGFQSASSKQFGSSTGEYIALVPYKEVVQKYGGWCSMGTEEFARRIRELGQDSRVKAIVLDFDSPGGAADAVQNPSAAILEARKNKPVLAYAGNGMVASAAYWMASHCDEIYATYASDEIGSIGTYVTMMNYEKFLAAAYETDVKTVYATASTEKNKGYRDLFSEKSSSEWLLTEDLDPFNDLFMQTVQNNRPNVNKDALKGALYMADKAQSMGLIDGIKTLNEVFDRAEELSSQTKNSKSMFKLFGGKDATKVSALLSAKPEDRTPEMISEAQAEMTETGFSLVSSAEYQAAEAKWKQESEAVATAQNSFNAVATAAGLTVEADGSTKNAAGETVVASEFVAALVAENKTLSEKSAELSAVDTSKKEESGAKAVVSAEVESMYADIDNKL